MENREKVPVRYRKNAQTAALLDTLGLSAQQMADLVEDVKKQFFNEDLMLCGVEDLEPMLYEIYQQPDIEHLVPQRAKDAAKHAYAKRRFPENMEKRNLRHREIWNEPIWAQRRIRKVNDSRLLRALQDAAAQRATSVLNLLSKLITYARKKILKGVDSYYEWKKLH